MNEAINKLAEMHHECYFKPRSERPTSHHAKLTADIAVKFFRFRDSVIAKDMLNNGNSAEYIFTEFITKHYNP